MDPVSYEAYHKRFQDLIERQDAKLHYTCFPTITDHHEALIFLRSNDRTNYALLSYIDPSIYDNELVTIACVKDPRSLLFAPGSYLTPKFFDHVFAVKHLKYMPHFSKEEWMCEKAVRFCYTKLEYVPSWMRTVELCKLAYKCDEAAMGLIPVGLRERVAAEVAAGI